jgi:hypothetical protein
LGFQKIIKSISALSIFAFQEPRVEPEFVLAWDEPNEASRKSGKAVAQTADSFGDAIAILPVGTKLTGNLEKDAGLIMEAFGGANNQSLGRRELGMGASSMVIFLFGTS